MRVRESSVATFTTLLAPVRMCAVNAECAWPVRQGRMSGRFRLIGLSRNVVLSDRVCEVNWKFITPLVRANEQPLGV